MKKPLYILLSVATLLGCTKTDVTYDDAPAGEISLSPVAGTITKAAITDGKYPTDNHIALYAYYTPSVKAGVVSDYSAFTKKYFNLNEFHFKKTLSEQNLWGGLDATYYWPTTGSLVFAGHSLPAPSTAGAKSESIGTTTYHLATDCLKIEGYVQSHDTGSTYDLLYFGRTASSYDRTSVSVPIAFSHALSWIEVQANGGTGALAHKWAITKVEIAGLQTKGDFIYTGTAAAGTDKANWENLAESHNRVIYDDAQGTILQSNFMTLEKAKDGALVIPQTPKVMNVTIEYKSPAGDGIKEVVEIDLSKHTQKWEAGKKYTYQLTFDPSEILVAPSVDTWPTSTATPIEY